MLALLLTLSTLAAPSGDDLHDFCGTFRAQSAEYLSRPQISPGSGDKEIVSWFEVGPSQLTSEHFVLHWGPDVDFDEERGQFILDELEAAWTVYVDEFGHVEADYAATTYLNAYIAGSYAGSPEAHPGGTAYHQLDPDNRSYLVFNAERLGGDTSWVRYVSAHEMYHAMQYASDTWMQFPEDVWWLEATAQSMSIRVLDDETWPITRIHALAFYPHLSVNAAESLDYDVTRSMHRYAMYLLVEEIIDEVGPEGIVETFLVPNDDFMGQLRTSLADEGADLDRVWADTMMRLPTWDFDNGEAYAEFMAGHADDPEAAHQFAIEIPPAGSTGLAAAPAETLPEAYGVNFLHWADPEPGTYALQIQFAAAGSQETTEFGTVGRLVQRLEDGSVTYQDLDLDLTTNEIAIGTDVEEAWVMVGVTGEMGNPYRAPVEVFSYDWVAFRTAELPGSEARACGCAASGGAGLGWMLGFLPLILARRRA